LVGVFKVKFLEEAKDSLAWVKMGIQGIGHTKIPAGLSPPPSQEFPVPLEFRGRVMLVGRMAVAAIPAEPET